MRQEKKTGGTKRALLTSVLAIVLCLVMLMGSTFAWFTDTASTGVNSIVSGTLDVGLSYWTGTDWADAENSEDLFNKTALWEPGYTQIVYLKVKNNGNLALNYAMQITPVHEQVGINVDGDEFKLSDYIQFGWAELTAAEDGTFTPFADRTAARTAVGTGVHLGETLRRQAEQPLNAGGETLVALVAWMPEEVGNVANYRDVAPSIELTLKVLATQATVESDSYNNLYDEAATEDELKDLPTYDYSYSELDGIILIPDENGDIVKAIVTEKAGKVPEHYFDRDSQYAGEKFAKLKEVVIQEGVTEVGASAFNMCKAIESLTLPSTLEKVDYRAFHHLESLKSVTIPEGTVLEEGAFRVTGLEEVTINGGSVGTQAFYGCGSLKKITINCDTVGDNAFASCGSLETVILDGVKTIGSFAFQKCGKLTSITIPESVISLGTYVFNACPLKSAVINAQCDTLPNNTFFGCVQLESLELSDTITKIDSFAVARCTKVTSCKVKAGTWQIYNTTYETDENGYLPEAALKVLFVRNSPVATYVPTP